MRLWRITTRQWALDTLCDGARQFGGRWNPVGTPALYAGTSIELCALEKFVHLAGATHPPLVLVAVDLPDDEVVQSRPPLAALPPDWADLPAPASTQEYGRVWLAAGSALALLIPSAIIPESNNVLINPRHPAYGRIKLSIVRAFSFDARMFKDADKLDP